VPVLSEVGWRCPELRATVLAAVTQHVEHPLKQIRNLLAETMSVLWRSSVRLVGGRPSTVEMS
jgi:hypothetical protein